MWEQSRDLDVNDRPPKVTKFTIFDNCPDCNGLNFKPMKLGDCKWCGNGRLAIDRIIRAIERRNRLKINKPKDRTPCKICSELYPDLEVYHD